MTSGSWEWHHLAGPAGELHADSAAAVASRFTEGAPGQAVPPARRAVRVLDASRPAVVLGSAQRDGIVDRSRAAAAGVDVVRRASGGGAVLVGPGSTLWVDLVLPAGDPLWSDDVGRAAWWVGEAWREALVAGAGRWWPPTLGPPEVWPGPMVRTAWSDLVCFAGLGPGEVTAPGADGRPVKVVGVSQRRTKRGALFQCAALLSWDPGALLDLLVLPQEKGGSGAAELADVAAPLDALDAPGRVELLDAFRAAVAAAR